MWNTYFMHSEPHEELALITVTMTTPAVAVPDKPKRPKRVKPPPLLDDAKQNAETIWVDENGRGALFGPLTVTAVYLQPGHGLQHVRDSKRMTELARERVWAAAQSNPHVHYFTYSCDVVLIDALGMEAAWAYSVRQALVGLCAKLAPLQLTPTRCVLDGSTAVTDTVVPLTSEVDADNRFVGVAVASVLGKVQHDRDVRRLAAGFPAFAEVINKCKGYGTKAHMALLRSGQYTPQHRRSFEPLRTMLHDCDKATS